MGNNPGPFSQQNLQQMISSGMLDSKDLAWHAEMTGWAELHTIQELAIHRSPPPMPNVPPRLIPEGHIPSFVSNYQVAWNIWNWPARTIFVAACAAVLSMFIDWVHVGFGSANGFSQGTFLFLGVFVYPLLVILKNQAMNKMAGIGCGVGGAILTIAYISSKQVTVFDRSHNFASGGAIIFLLASIALAIGAGNYQPSKIN